jgi:succinate-semialdehyde dehydrogenase / glutarate-semialdehyde dehydrogenase
MLGQIAYECGLPDGALSILNGDPAMISDKLLGSDVIRGVTFTGSTNIGKLLTGKAVSTMKRPIMELGGHSPVIVCADVDIDKTVLGAIGAKYRNAGQICVSPTRFLVHSSIYEEFTGCMAEAASKLVVGNGFDPSTTMGPMANMRRVSEMKAIVDDAHNRNIRVLTGGSAPDREGAYFDPTVLADVTVDALSANVEPFGPVALMTPFDDLGDALTIANRLPFGLAAYVMTNNIQTAQRCTSQIQAGNVIVNAWRATLPETPFGGHKESGLASEGGIEGLLAFQNIKLIYQA